MDPISYPSKVLDAATRLGRALEAAGLKVVCAESCTGGLIALALTEVGGSSAWFERGFVTYSNDAKVEVLGVSPDMLARHGAVSEPVAQAMARGALAASRSQLALSVTGIAGPGGGSTDKPVGTVCFGWALALPGEQIRIESGVCHFSGDRAGVRAQSAQHALERALRVLGAEVAAGMQQSPRSDALVEKD